MKRQATTPKPTTPGEVRHTKLLPRFFIVLFFSALLGVVPSVMPEMVPEMVADRAADRAAEQAPNMVLVLVDDAGLMDFGSYGGEARTPTIDQLADQGVQFSNYHTSPLCAPSRAMLLTGLDNHLTGVATIPEILTPDQATQPGYSMHLESGVQTVASILSRAGYRTYMTGKWHLGSGEGDLPNAHGFDRSFALDASGADNWEQKSYLPYYDHAPWFEDGEPGHLPEDFYSSAFMVDQMIEYLEKDSQDDRPFFSYIAFQAVHIPVQAPREFTDHYEGVYKDGWQALQADRFRRAQAIGLVPRGAPPPLMHPSLRPWKSLSDADKAFYERSMMVNAGMLEAMDFHLGRFVTWLKDKGHFDNTIFIITSDNGPEFNDPAALKSIKFWMQYNGYHFDTERLGERGSMGAIGPEWASAAATPGSLFKFYASEGGMRVPLIVSGPGVARGGLSSALSFVVDVTPTMLDYAGIMLAAEDVAGMTGTSLRPVLELQAPRIYPEDAAIGMEVSGNAALFKGDYKLTRNGLPHGDGNWRLYQVTLDPAEMNDLAAEAPALMQTMLEDYRQYAEAVGLVTMPAEFNILAQLQTNTVRKLLEHNLGTLLIILTLLVTLFAATGWWLISRRNTSRRPAP